MKKVEYPQGQVPSGQTGLSSGVSNTFMYLVYKQVGFIKLINHNK